MARLYEEEGLSYTEIGAREGISRQRVGHFLTPLGLAPGRSRRGKIAREQRLRAMHTRIMARELTLEEAATELGYSSGETIRAILKEIGLRVVLPRELPPHGTVARYKHRKEPCRCADCRAANVRRNQDLRGEEPPTHGASGYKNYGCRCQQCTEANRLYSRARRAAKRRQRKGVTS